MRLGIALFAALLIGQPTYGQPVPATDPLFSDAARQLDGEWHGGPFVLRVDAKRAQASTAPDRPFEWQRFVVRETAGNEIVFAIGSDLFEATIGDDTLVLTSTGFRGERVLFRGAGIAGQDAAGDMGLRGTAD